MTIPVFIDIEASINDKQGFPTAMCWSLTNGQMKSVLIIPEDEWLEEDEGYEQHTDVTDLYNHGEAVLDIAREINEDLDGKTVYMPGSDFEGNLINKLFSAYDIEPSFEINPLSEFLEVNQEDVPDRLQLTRQDYGIESPHPSEANVLAMLYIAREYGLL